MIYISIISHGHSGLIRNNKELIAISGLDSVTVVVKDNVGQGCLESYCSKNNIDYLNKDIGLGFGANNNYVFNHVIRNYDVEDSDYFLVMNPDVYVTEDNFSGLIESIAKQIPDVCTIDLFKDSDYKIRDPFIRKFPKFTDFVLSFIFGRNNTVVDRVNGLGEIDWCAGSFICFKVEVYMSLNGFDEGYFMYCEDIDICYRAKLLNYRIIYIQKVKALHFARHSNKRLLSTHFIWHFKSVFRFLVLKNFPVFSKCFGVRFKSRI